MLCRWPLVRDHRVKEGDVAAYVPLSRYESTKEARLAGMPLPCGRCLPCRINQSLIWTGRMLLEAKCHPCSIFVTLTYSDENLPEDMSVQVSDLQNFLKRLRYNLSKPIRYFAVGEYGDQSWRPHYHLAIFGLMQSHKLVVKRSWSKDGKMLGYVYVGDLSKDSARYIAGYCTSKLTKRKTIGDRTKEFATMSKKGGGIGYPRIIEIADQLNKSGFQKKEVIRTLGINGRTYPLGRYLTRKLAELINIPPEQIERELFLHQKEYFDKHLKKGDYYENIVNEEKQKAHCMEKRYKMFERKAQI